MTKFNWVDITREDVIRAVEKFLAENPEYPEPRSTFLVYEGKKLPAKHIRGMAYTAHYGVEISKADFGGGMETVKFFERLGFEVDYRGISAEQPKTEKVTVTPAEEQDDAAEELKKLIPEALSEVKIEAPAGKEKLKVCMYLQCDELKNRKGFNKAAEIIRKSDIDILVLPETCYVPNISKLNDVDIAVGDDCKKVDDFCIDLSKDLGCAVVVSTCDKYGTLYSVFANAFAAEEEVSCLFYIKHTATECSAFDFENYSDFIDRGMLDPFNFKGFRIGLTICYDCNHAIYSRMYELHGGVDLILNSTGGDVVFDKWFKFNKCRAIENHCYELVTMGGDGTVKNPHCYVYGFNPNGGQLKPVNLNGPSDVLNYPGGLYVYEITKDEGSPEADTSNQSETPNKNWQLEIPVGNAQAVLDKAERITDQIYKLKVGNENVFFCLVDGMDIMKPEKILPLLYASELKKHWNRRYIIINRHKHIDKKFFREKLSTVLKVRAMENYCAVVVESDEINKCYQTGKNRTAQVVAATNGFFGIDLERTTGAEAIWKNKVGMKASWRKNYEWLVDYAAKL